MADWMDNINSFLGNYGTNNLGGTVGQAAALAYLPAAIAGGYQNWQNAGNISDTAERASQIASPVSLGERQNAQYRLNELYTNPTAFLQKNPEFMASMDLGLDTLTNQLGRMGMANSGNAISDAMKFQTKLSSQYLDQDARRLMEMGGYQFNPASAGEMLMRGAEGEAKYKNDAIDSILATLGLLAGGNRAGGVTGANNPNGSGGPGSNSPGTRVPTPNGGSGPSAASKIPNVPANALMQFLQQNGATTLTPQLLMQFLSSLPPGSIDPAYFDALQGGSAASSFGGLTGEQIGILRDLGFQLPMVQDPVSGMYWGGSFNNLDPIGLGDYGQDTPLGNGMYGQDPLSGMYDIPYTPDIPMPDYQGDFNFTYPEFNLDLDFSNLGSGYNWGGGN